MQVNLPLWLLSPLRLRVGGGVGHGVGAQQIGMAGEGVSRLAVHQETNFYDAGKVGIEGAEDGVDGEGLGLDAGGVMIGEAAVEVDHG